MARKELKEFALVYGDIYFQGIGEILTCVVSKAQAKEELQRAHDRSCGDNNVSHYRHL